MSNYETNVKPGHAQDKFAAGQSQERRASEKSVGVEKQNNERSAAEQGNQEEPLTDSTERPTPAVDRNVNDDSASARCEADTADDQTEKACTEKVSAERSDETSQQNGQEKVHAK